MRWIMRLLGIVVLIVAFAIGAVFFLPKDRIASIAADQVRAQTGRELTLGGDLALSFWPVLGVSTGPVTLSNADWAGENPIISAQSVSIGVDAAALLRGDIRVQHIEAQSPVVRLATRADGTGNWVFGGPTASPTEAASGEATGAVTLERLRLSDAHIIYEAAGQAPVSVTGVTATLDWPDPSGPAQFDTQMQLGETPLALSGQIEDFAGFLSNAVAPLQALGATEGGRIEFVGRASMAGDAAGRVSLDLTDTGAVLAALGVEGSTPPAGLGRQIRGAADVTFTGGDRLSLRDLTMALDQNSVSGAADLILAEVPKITAQLTAGALDLSQAAGSAGGASGASAAAGSGWPKDPIDASALSLVNADVSLTAQSIALPGLRLGPSQLGLTLDRARAVLQLKRVAVFDGTLTGQLVANNRDGLSVGGAVTARKIEMERLLTDLADITRLSGKAEAQVEFLGVGQTMDAIMRSLSGKGSLAMGRGVISGIDLDRLMRSGVVGGGTTVFDSLAASFTLQNGNVLNEDLLLLLANFRAEGEGRIGLGAQDIDYLFTPIALRANSGQGLAIPVRITGPWSSPRIIPDLEQALQLDVDGKVEEVKQDARDRVEQKLQEELGVTRQEGQSTEDAIKDALEDRAKNKLLDLLSGN